MPRWDFPDLFTSAEVTLDANLGSMDSHDLRKPLSDFLTCDFAVMTLAIDHAHTALAVGEFHRSSLSRKPFFTAKKPA